MTDQNQQQSKHKLWRKASGSERIISAYIFAIVAIICTFIVLAAYNKIDIGRFISPCGFKMRYNLPCPTCGVTTSALAFFRGHIATSFYIQPAGALLCCILILSGFLTFLTAVFGVYFSFLDRLFARVKLRHVIVAVIVVFAFGWMVTMTRALINRG